MSCRASRSLQDTAWNRRRASRPAFVLTCLTRLSFLQSAFSDDLPPRPLALVHTLEVACRCHMLELACIGRTDGSLSSTGWSRRQDPVLVWEDYGVAMQAPGSLVVFPFPLGVRS